MKQFKKAELDACKSVQERAGYLLGCEKELRSYVCITDLVPYVCVVVVDEVGDAIRLDFAVARDVPEGKIEAVNKRLEGISNGN